MSTYQVKRKLGQGGMGIVYLALHVELGREVALKTIAPELTARDDVRQRFVREIKALMEIKHPNVIRILDYGKMEDRWFFAMDLMTGRSLSRLVKEGGPLDPVRALRLFRQGADAMAYCHERSIVHRDVKPSNLIVDADDHLTLMDFGLVRIEGGTVITTVGRMLGTPRYFAPEIVKGKRGGAEADVYALAVSFYEALTGESPYPVHGLDQVLARIVGSGPVPLTQMCPDAPPPLSALFDHVFTPDPGARPTAADLVREIDSALSVLTRSGPSTPLSVSKPHEVGLQSGSGLSSPPRSGEGARGAGGISPAGGRPRQVVATRPSWTDPVAWGSTGVRRTLRLPRLRGRHVAVAVLASIALPTLAVVLMLVLRPGPAATTVPASGTPATPPARISRLPADVVAAKTRALGEAIGRCEGRALAVQDIMERFQENPAFPDFEATSRRILALERQEQSDLDELSRISDDLHAAYPDPEAMPDDELRAFARAAGYAFTRWSRVARLRQYAEIFGTAMQGGVSYFADLAQFLWRLDSETRMGGEGLPLMGRYHAATLVDLRRMARRPEEAPPDAASVLWDLRAVAEYCPHSQWGEDVKTEAMSQIDRFRRGLTELPDPCGPTLGQAALGLWDLGWYTGLWRLRRDKLQRIDNHVVALMATMPAATAALQAMHSRIQAEIARGEETGRPAPARGRR